MSAFPPVELVDITRCAACGRPHHHLEWHPFPVTVIREGRPADGSVVCPVLRVLVYTCPIGELAH